VNKIKFALHFFFPFWDGVESSPLLVRPLNGLLHQPRLTDDADDDECGAIGGMFGRGNQSTRR
jgi:hypothetical protein